MSDISNMSILITGAEGFIGSHLARRLVREGARLSALVHPAVARTRLAGIKNDITIYPLDIRDRRSLEELVGRVKPRRIFHLAAVTDVGRSWESLSAALAVNLEGTVNLLRALRRVEYEIMIATCTAEVYGRNPAPFREEMPLDPVSPYSFSKAATTLFCRMAAASLGSSVRILRLFLVYGPGQGEERFLPQLIRAGLSGEPFRMTTGEQTREYTYIDDAVEGFIAGARGGPGKGEVYNIGSGEEISLRDLVSKVENCLGKKVALKSDILPYRKNEIWRLVGDHAKAASNLKWRSRTSLDAGLRKTIAWSKNRNWDEEGRPAL